MSGRDPRRPPRRKALGFAALRQREAARRRRGHAGERRTRRLPVLEVAERHAAAPNAALLERTVENQKAIGSANGSGWISTPSTTLKSVALIPIPRARQAMTTAVTPPSRIKPRREHAASLTRAQTTRPGLGTRRVPETQQPFGAARDELRIEQPRPTSGEHVVPTRPDRTISFLTHPR